VKENKYRWVVLAGGFVFIFLVGLFWLSHGDEAASRETADDREVVMLQRVSAPKAEILVEQFTRYNYVWPPLATGTVPPLEVAALPDDLSGLGVKVKKSLFFRTMLPLILAENRTIEMKRRWLEELFAVGAVRQGTTEWGALRQVADYYRVKGDINDAAVRREVLKRIDILPVALVLAQAAQESGWGTSRFARQGNSLFGEWTFRKGAGIRPGERLAGANHSVRAFPTLRASVKSYMRNINISRAYRELRTMREHMRVTDQPFNSHTLASGLRRYSQRGELYVRDIRSIIKGNGLDLLGEVRMASWSGDEKPWMTVPVESPGQL